MPNLSDYELDLLTARLPKPDVSPIGPGMAGGITGMTIGSLISPALSLPGALAGTAIGALGSGRRRQTEENIFRAAIRRNAGSVTTEDIRELAKRVAPAAPHVIGTAGTSGLLTGALGAGLAAHAGKSVGRGALGGGLTGAGVGALVGAIHAAANRARIKRLLREETQ